MGLLTRLIEIDLILGSGGKGANTGVQEMLSMRGREQMDVQFAPQDVST